MELSVNASNHEEFFVRIVLIINSFFICDIYIYIWGREREGERAGREGGERGREREREEREGGVCGGQRSAIVGI